MYTRPFISRLALFLLVLTLLLVFFPCFTFSAQEGVSPVFRDFPLPESLSLCNDPMPLGDLHVREMLDREFTISVWDHGQVFMWLKRAGRYFPYIEKKLAEAGMPDDLKYLAVAESSLLTRIRSNKGAIGIWQFMAPTARRNGLRRDRMMDERRNFELSTEAAINYLKRLHNMLGNWTLALAAYNCGEARLKKEIKTQKISDYYRLELPVETERFIYRIAAIKIIMANPKHYGYILPRVRAYTPVKGDSVPVKIRAPIHMSNVARLLGTDLKALKELNPQIIGHYLPTGRYTIKVPPGMGSKVANVLKELTPKSSGRMKKVMDGYYVVGPGDSLSKIAKRTGVSVKTLRRLNGIQGSLIKVGQRLRLKP